MHGDDSFWVKSNDLEARSRGRTTRSRASGSTRYRGNSSIPTHVDLDVSSWADVVKAQKAKFSDTANGNGDNSSQHSATSDKSTIQSVKSHREQELETMVEKLSVENNELKLAQETALQSQRELLQANRELIEQVQIIKTQLATVKNDIRKEFDLKIDTIFGLFRGAPYPAMPPPPTKTPRSPTSYGENADSPERKKHDSKSTPMQERLSAIEDEQYTTEQLHTRNWLLHKFNAATGYTPTVNPYGYAYVAPYGTMTLPQAQAEQPNNVG